MLLARSEATGADRRSVALHGVDDFAVEQGAKGIVVVAREVGAKVFFGLATGEVGLKQALDSIGNVFGSGTVAQRARSAGVFADGSADAEVEGVYELAILLDLLAFKSNIGYPVLAATVGAAGNVQLDLLVEAGETVFHLADQPLRKAFGFGNGELAELGAGAGDGAAPEGRDVDLEAERVQLDHERGGFLVGHVDDQDVLHDGRAEFTAA